MRISVRAFNEAARFTAHLPPEGTLHLAGQETVQAVLDALNIPADVQANLVVFRNGRPAASETKLGEGDRLVLFAPMTGG